MNLIAWVIGQLVGIFLKFKITNDPKIKQLVKEGDELTDQAREAVKNLEDKGLQVPNFMKKYSSKKLKN